MHNMFSKHKRVRSNLLLADDLKTISLKQIMKEPIGFSIIIFIGEFDPGSGRTLAACLTHASRTGHLFR